MKGRIYFALTLLLGELWYCSLPPAAVAQATTEKKELEGHLCEEERAVPECGLETRLPASPFVARNLGAAAHSKHGSHLVLREAGVLAVGPEVIVEFGAGHCLRRSGSLRATSVMATD